MNNDPWVWPDRRDLYHACLALADPEVVSERVSEAADILLNDLELYSDPDQGRGCWLFSDEALIADDLATKLHAIVGAEPLSEWGRALIRHSLWQGVSLDARNLLALINRNGQGAPPTTSTKR